MSLPLLLLISLVGGILALDRTAFLQSMISRPIITGPITGFLMGDLTSGAICGMLIEPIWLSRLPVGGSVPPDDTLATIASVAAATVLARSGLSPAYALFAVPIGLPFGWIGRWADIRVRRTNGELFTKANALLAKGTVPRLGPINMTGALRYFFTGIALTAFAVVMAMYIADLILIIWPNYVSAKAAAGLLAYLPLIGAGALLTGLGGKEGRIAFSIGLALSLFTAMEGLG